MIGTKMYIAEFASIKHPAIRKMMLPVCKALGYDVVAFGVMATVNLAIGQVTPPVGVNLFVAISIKIKKGLEVTLQQITIPTNRP